MHYLSLDYLIVYSFLLITLIIGLRAGRGIQSMQEYALAGRQFGTVALTLTYLATNIAGASVFDSASDIFNEGIIVTAALLMLVFTFLFMAFFIAPHAVKFTDCLTMGDLVGHFYGTASKIIAGCLGVLTTFCIATMELNILGEVAGPLLGWSREWTIVLGGAGLALYAMHGGIKAVTATDVFQFLVLLVGIPIMAALALEKAGGMYQLVEQVPSEKLKIWSHPELSRHLAMALIWLIPLGAMDPAIMQRLLMGRSRKDLRTQYLLIAAFDPMLQITLMLIGLAGIVLYPNLDGMMLVPHMVHDLLPVGCKGLIIAGLMGVIMSTIDSYLHVLGLTAVHDLWQPLRQLMNKKPIDEQVELRYTRYATLLLSGVAIACALGARGSDSIDFLLMSLELSGPLLMFPLFSGMMGLKTQQRDFYVAGAATILVFAYTKWIAGSEDHFVALACTIANGSVFFGMHVYRHRGGGAHTEQHG